MKTAGALAAALSAVFFSFAHADTINLDKLASQVQKPTVQIQMPEGLCSGTIVASKRDEKTGDVSTIILTAEHCVKEAPYRTQKIVMPIYGSDGLPTGADMQLADVVKQGIDTNDLALLKLKEVKTSYTDRVAKVAAHGTNPKFGEQVFAAGYSLGRALGVTEGRFNSREEFNFPDDKSETVYYRASPAIAPGNSGGGFWHVNSAGDFELIGVADWKVGQDMGQFGAYTPLDRVVKFLNDYDKALFPDSATK